MLLVVPIKRKRAHSSRLTCAECGQKVRRGSTVVAVRRREMDDDGDMVVRIAWCHDVCAEASEPTLFGGADD